LELPDHRQRKVRTAIILFLLVLIFVPASRGLLFEQHLFRYVDAKATAYVDAGLVRAGAAFATARTFNAIISVFEESELQLEPGGVGVSLALGEALDPANDLVERFSWVMLASLTSLGIQKVLIEITPFVSVQIILVLALLALLAGLWRPTTGKFDFSRLGRILLLCAILLRFAVPVMAALNHQVYVVFLAERETRSIEALGQTRTTLEAQQIDRFAEDPQAVRQDAEPDTEGWWNRTKSRVVETVDQGKKILDLQARLEVIKAAAVQLIDRVVDLIVVFVLSTMALPLLFLWGLFKLGKLLLETG
jgi:hypothetical protein